ncbi:helix-turn-helix transcriptional regulator [Herbaspirillum frisingense]|uniref:Transcriptional regulator with XRE-family HTH domain n=1 Tax=Herbaspirillum frisingense TaxID=92645 RepID=A0ABU1PCY6_9BURK|nr:helix-turn-helix transcriptional regulator [Herbaspirillum frisingense]MDR6583791.1 transcriptional regulator with XRE-family HTH domain [Herbaspirillum frisingense]
MKSTLGDKIRSRLKELGRSQGWLAEQANVSDTAVSKWISTGKISRKSAQDAARALGISIDVLIGAEPANDESGQNLALIYADADEIRLLTLYREASEMGRALIRTAADAAPKAENLESTPFRNKS